MHFIRSRLLFAHISACDLSGALVLAALLLLGPSASAQGKVDKQLLGEWVGTSETNKGQSATVGKDFIVLGGERLALRFVSSGLIEVGGKGGDRVAYRLRGDTLMTQDEDGTVNWRRVRAKTAKPVKTRGKGGPKQNPLDTEPRNPLDTPPDTAEARDPFARKFEGTDISLTLASIAANTYRGQLSFQGKAYPVEATAKGSSVSGTFRTPGGTDFPFTAKLVGDQLTLTSGSKKYRLNGKPAVAVRRQPKARSTSAMKSTLRLKRYTYKDAGFGGIESHTLMMPTDWTGKAGVIWTNTPLTFVHFVGEFTGPNESSITWAPNQSFAQATDQRMIVAHLQQARFDRSRLTQVAWPPRQAGETAVQYILPKVRPKSTNVRVVKTKNYPEVEKILLSLAKPMMQNLPRTVRIHVRAEQTTVTYDENGRSWDEVFEYVVLNASGSHRSQLYNADFSNWQILGTVCLRAPRGQLSSRLPQLAMIAGTLKETPRWNLSLQKLRMELSKIQHKQNMFDIKQFSERARLIAKNNATISDSQYASWKKQQASRDRIQKSTINSILDVKDYKLPGGGTISIDSGYDRVFRDSLGNMVLTNNPSYEIGLDKSLTTTDWSQLSRLKHAGR